MNKLIIVITCLILLVFLIQFQVYFSAPFREVPNITFIDLSTDQNPENPVNHVNDETMDTLPQNILQKKNPVPFVSSERQNRAVPTNPASNQLLLEKLEISEMLIHHGSITIHRASKPLMVDGIDVFF